MSQITQNKANLNPFFTNRQQYHSRQKQGANSKYEAKINVFSNITI